MDKKMNKMFKDIKGIELSDKKRREMRTFLESEIGLTNNFFWQSIFLKRYVLVSILMVFLAFSGITFAAEKSLPGDLFYPIKINSNEKIIGALKFSEESKNNWDKRKLERRVEEYDALEEKGLIISEESKAKKNQPSGYHTNDQNFSEEIEDDSRELEAESFNDNNDSEYENEEDINESSHEFVDYGDDEYDENESTDDDKEMYYNNDSEVDEYSDESEDESLNSPAADEKTKEDVEDDADEEDYDSPEVKGEKDEYDEISEDDSDELEESE